MKLKVAVVGAKGRMGKEVCNAIARENDLELFTAIDIEDSINQIKGAQIMVDFTTPDAVMNNLEFAINSGIHAIVGTTGFTSERIEKVEKLAMKNNKVGVLDKSDLISGKDLITSKNSPVVAATSILNNYTQHFNELLANGGVRNGNTIVTPANQLEQYSDSRLANMTPDEILNLGQTANPSSVYFGVHPNSDNFSDRDNFDYERALRMLLLHTNENGVLTNNVTEHGELLYGAIMDLQRNIRLNNRNAIQRQQRNVNNPNTNPPSPTPVVPGSLIDMTLHEYNIMLDELRRHGGVRATNIDDDLEVVLPFDRIVTYSQLAHMTPAQILNINPVSYYDTDLTYFRCIVSSPTLSSAISDPSLLRVTSQGSFLVPVVTTSGNVISNPNNTEPGLTPPTASGVVCVPFTSPTVSSGTTPITVICLVTEPSIYESPN